MQKEVYVVTSRKIYLLLCVSSLSLGVLLYILFRENSYIGIATNHFTVVSAARKVFAFLSCDFLMFYFPDFLWCFSLCFGLFAIYLPTQKQALMCVLTAILFGCTWELLQYVGLISGTGDLLDALMYLLSGIICAILNMIRGKRHEKN